MIGDIARHAAYLRQAAEYGRQITKKAPAIFAGACEWRPQGDLNPRHRRERPASWTVLDDGDVYGGSCRIRTCDSRLKRPILYQLS